MSNAVDPNARDTELAKCILEKIEEHLSQNVAVGQIAIPGGLTISFRSLDELRRYHAYWRKIAGRADGTRPVISRIRIF